MKQMSRRQAKTMNKSSIPPHDAANPIDQAREYHRRAMESDEAGRRYRDQRDILVRQLWNQQKWTLAKMARQLDVSPELVSKIVNHRRKLAHLGQR